MEEEKDVAVMNATDQEVEFRIEPTDEDDPPCEPKDSLPMTTDDERAPDA